MDRQPVLEGERLLLRPMRPDDRAALYAVASDPLIWVMHPASDRWQEPVFDRFFDEGLARGGALTVIDRASGQVIGSSSMKAYDDPADSAIEIGWTYLARSHWGGGYNREMKRLMLAHAFRFVERVDFRVGEHNLRSCRALEKVGARLTDRDAGIVQTPTGPWRYLVYAITRKDFANGPLWQG
jgi:RimJ/RimL family protein N-acetyltransferase